ncbi:MAG: PocR ligand-binding domain-containing protein [Kiritimatiellales bacterium]
MDISGNIRFVCQMMEPLNYRISRQVYEIFDLYTELHGARVSLFGPGGELLYPDAQSRPNCTYCSLLRETMGLDAYCRESDQQMMQEALRKRSMVTYTCHAGMREAVAPLFVDNGLVGFVMIGQFRSEAADSVSPYAARWKKEQSDQRLQKAFSQSTVIPDEKIDTLLAMLRQMIELMISSQLICHEDYDLIQSAIERMREHPELQLSLTEAARISGRSASAVSRLFKKLTGRSFKQYQIQFRLQQAAHQLASAPARPVAEIARSVGFEDQFYFSRLFRRHMGRSPSEYRNHNTGA